MHYSAPRGRAGLAWAVLLATAAAGGYWSWHSYLLAAPVTGVLRLETVPPGASVELEGRLRGLTPLTLTLGAGTYKVSLSHDGRTEHIAAAVTPGGQSVHHVRWANPVAIASPAVTTLVKGRLQIISDPAGAMVTLDGVARGPAPMELDEIDPGEHQVVVQHMGRTLRRTVTVESGATASLAIANPLASTESGWLSIHATAPLQVFEAGRLIGSTDDDRITLPAGTHTLALVAEPLGFRASRTVTIAAGEATSTTISLPRAPMHITAVPWADAFIGGQPLGRTPIADLMQPIGTHLVELRHPEFGTKQATVTVSLAQPVRVAVDMRAP